MNRKRLYTLYFTSLLPKKRRRTVSISASQTLGNTALLTHCSRCMTGYLAVWLSLPVVSTVHGTHDICNTVNLSDRVHGTSEGGDTYIKIVHVSDDSEDARLSAITRHPLRTIVSEDTRTIIPLPRHGPGGTHMITSALRIISKFTWQQLHIGQVTHMYSSTHPLPC